MTEPDAPPPDPGRTRHEIVNPPSLAPAVGYAHAVVAAAGRTIYLGGQTAHGPDGTLRGETLEEQFDGALANVVTALEAAGARPEHLVSVQILTTDLEAYRARTATLGDAWRQHLGRHYPAVALVEVAGLFDPRARIELVCVAVVPDG